MFFRAFAVLALCAVPAAAECLKAEDFVDSEVTVALQAGDEWRISVGEMGVQAEYRDRYGEPLRWQVGHHGVFPAFEQQNRSVDPASGNVSPFPVAEWQVETVYDETPPVPEAGGNFSTTGTTKGEFDGVTKSWKFTVAYTFDPEKTVTLSGCRYRAIGVNGNFHAAGDDWTGRWVYFPDLGVGIQTKGNDSRTGEAWVNGMIGMGG